MGTGFHIVDNCLVCNHALKKAFIYQSFSYYRCPNCGILTTFPLPDETSIEEHYAQGFKQGNYYRLLHWRDDYRKVYQDMAELIKKQLESRGFSLDTKSVLDIGCFTADFIEILSQYGCDVYGLELQKEAVEIANQRLPGRVFAADIYNNVFPEKTFDIISMTGLIEHVLEPVKLLERCFEKLKPGGIMIIQTPDSDSLLASVMGKYWPPVAPIEHIYLFSNRGLKMILKACGFVPIWYKVHIKWLPVEYVYNNLEMFGPNLQRLISPIYHPLRKILSHVVLPFYGGEIILLAQKPLD